MRQSLLSDDSAPKRKGGISYFNQSFTNGEGQPIGAARVPRGTRLPQIKWRRKDLLLQGH